MGLREPSGGDGQVRPQDETVRGYGRVALRPAAWSMCSSAFHAPATHPVQKVKAAFYPQPPQKTKGAQRRATVLCPKLK